ncbi:MAG: hypothetical protein FWH26_00355 [Oscillospiraceae bacterium]|nr:hypothetical protein [Oscillospiraceae bacterium]
MLKKSAALIAVLCLLCLAGCGRDTLLTGLGAARERTVAPGAEAPGIADMDDSALAGYLLANAEDARERAARDGFEPRVPGDVTRLPMAGLCRDVLLGSVSAGGDFHVEIHYSVSPAGVIYKYFPEAGDWGIIYRPGYFG